MPRMTLYEWGGPRHGTIAKRAQKISSNATSKEIKETIVPYFSSKAVFDVSAESDIILSTKKPTVLGPVTEDEFNVSTTSLKEICGDRKIKKLYFSLTPECVARNATINDETETKDFEESEEENEDDDGTGEKTTYLTATSPTVAPPGIPTSKEKSLQPPTTTSITLTPTPSNETKETKETKETNQMPKELEGEEELDELQHENLAAALRDTDYCFKKFLKERKSIKEEFIEKDNGKVKKVKSETTEKATKSPHQPEVGKKTKAKGKVTWKFGSYICHGILISSMETFTHCYARTHKGNVKTLKKGGTYWSME